MITTHDLYTMKQNKEKITMLTAYDYPSAKQAEAAGVDTILVGDSLGMTVLGYQSTVEVTLDDMIHHAKAVRRGAPDTYVVVDMPFGSYHVSREQAVQNAIRLYQESGANAVKLEGRHIEEFIPALVAAGVPVVGHLGLTPQSVGITGFKMQAGTKEDALELLEAVEVLEALGAVMVIVEAIPSDLAEKVSEKVDIPIIGIGAGVYTDGQVLVYHDVLKYGTDFAPKFVKQFGDFDAVGIEGIKQYVKEVKDASFPSDETTYKKKVFIDDENNK